jgi:hypothetical protein
MARQKKGKVRAQAARLRAKLAPAPVSPTGDVLDDALRNPAVALPSPEVKLAHDAREAAARQAARQTDDQLAPDAVIYPVVCDGSGTHVPWRPVPIRPGAPQPTAGHCPFCTPPPAPPVEQRMTVYLDATAPAKVMSPESEQRYEDYRNRQRARGVLFPGDPVHDAAVEQLDADRRVAIRRDRTPREHRGMRRVFYRPTGGLNGGPREIWVPDRPKRTRPSQYWDGNQARIFVES